MRRIYAALTAAAMAFVLAACCNAGVKQEEGNKMIRLNVTVTTDAGNLGAVIDGLNRLAAASRQEEGCIGYEIYQNTANPAELVIVETWRDQAALDAHAKTPHYTTELPPVQEKARMKLDRFEY